MDAVKSAEKAERVLRRQVRQRRETRVNVVTPQAPQADVTSQLLQQMVKMSERQDKILEILVQQQGQSTQQHASQNPPVQQQMQNDGKRKPGRFQGKCHHCGIVGHKFYECRKRQQQQQQEPKVSVITNDDQPDENQTEVDGPPQQVLPRVRVAMETSLQEADVRQGRRQRGEEVKQAVSRNEAGLPVCKLTIQDAQPVACLLDSGASVSIVSEEFARGLGLDVDESRSARRLVAANGGQLPTLGSMELEVGVGDGKLKHSFAVVEEFSFPVLLGHDFLVRVEAVLDFSKGTVSLCHGPSKGTVELTVRQLLSEGDVSGEDKAEHLTAQEERTCVLTSIA